MSRHQLPAPRTAPNHLNTPPATPPRVWAALGASGGARRPGASAGSRAQGKGRGAAGRHGARARWLSSAGEQHF